MRTTVATGDELLAAAKLAARQRGYTLAKLVEDAIRRELAALTPGKSRSPYSCWISWMSFEGVESRDTYRHRQRCLLSLELALDRAEPPRALSVLDQNYDGIDGRGK
jgi:hypothetical protein